MSTKYMLTTVDNPFNPFNEFVQWYNFDEAAGYSTSGLLARVAKTSDELSPRDQQLELDRAMIEIAHENVSGMHRLVSETSWPLPHLPG